MRHPARNTIAWIGMALMAISFAWLQWLPRAERRFLPRLPAPPEPFNVVVVDPGHGGKDSGAMVDTLMEKDLSLDVAQRLDRRLQSYGVATVMTRTGDSYVSLAERAALTNRVENGIFISIHFNEGNKAVSSGVETYYADHQLVATKPLIAWLPFLQRTAAYRANPESQSLAGHIQESLVARTQSIDRGTKAEQFFVIANVRHPAALVEGGFLSNKEDIARLTSEDYRERLASAIADGILHYRDVLRQRPARAVVSSGDGAE